MGGTVTDDGRAGFCVGCDVRMQQQQRRGAADLPYFLFLLFFSTSPWWENEWEQKKMHTSAGGAKYRHGPAHSFSLSPSVSRSRCKCGLLRYPLYRNRTALYSVSSTARSLPNSYCYRDCDAEVYSLWYPTKNSITHRQGKATQVKARPQLYPLLLSILWYTYDANSTHNCNEHRYLAQTGRRL